MIKQSQKQELPVQAGSSFVWGTWAAPGSLLTSLQCEKQDGIGWHGLCPSPARPPLIPGCRIGQEGQLGFDFYPKDPTDLGLDVLHWSSKTTDAKALDPHTPPSPYSLPLAFIFQNIHFHFFYYF